MAAKPPTRLAILMADTPMPNTAAKYGDYGGLFTSLFTTAAQPEPIESILSITKHDIVNHVGSYPSLDDVDAVLITGSKHSAFADDAWIMALVDYTRRALLETNGRVKVVGICFGHQIVARALGGKVVVNEKGWEVAVTEVELTERAREFFGLETLRIHQMHRDIVPELPKTDPPTMLLASNNVCQVQGMLWPGRCVTVQGHPEFTEEVVREVLETRHDAGIHPDDLYNSGISRVANQHDGIAIAKGFLKFLRL
ncbi:hypothetical protein MCOR27_002457 [Pyricularia oryzae]|uniref:Glutamine amidotransferase domain-containing protein n=4 Tax=Pyricularia TaxID=48558 RepID=A0ABQ8NRG3_PYRGI|nr:GMP synthase [Pyricularia oryzae 70-15]ELQ32689.1 GMP synthase [Pyricularia oryzae Y34]KAH8845357.1 hypothetical protein MCOR01_002601 [Pyricularia oryzae]KAI6300927.1 hypothetical protein MCOR33_003409 [Pyricularia grisea]EHA46802.1 GMP synthase [Pyricularia oryzae 70-15]KAI6255131.1 hypothetical protein MCOR19_008385 [Pyricularia oryzae]